MNYYEHHIGDYAAATAHLSWDEDMAYTRLIRVYYHNEKGIPAAQAYRLARAQTPEQREAVDTVLDEFFVLDDDMWIQKRCEEEIERFQDKQSKAKASAKARWDKEKRTQCERNADAMQTQCEGNAPRHQTPDTNTSTSLRSVDGARATRLPKDWKPPDEGWEMAIKALGTNAAIVELDKFRDYWLAKAGKDSTKRDWAATWRNWVRKASEYAKNRRDSSGGERLSAVERVRRKNAAALEGDGEILASDDGGVRPQVDECTRGRTNGVVVDGSFRDVDG